MDSEKPTLKLSVCVEMIFTELPFVDRIAAVAEAGFGAYEFWHWRNRDIGAIKRAADRAGLALSGLVLDTTGALVSPETHGQLLRDATETFAAAQELGTQTVIAQTGNERMDVPRAEQQAAIVAGLRELATHAQEAGITVVVEPLNTLVDHPGYFLSSMDEASELLRRVDSPAVRLLFDVYHQQVTEGNLTARLAANRDLIGHVHVAGVPGRHEPGHGEINYAFLMEELRSWPYRGYVGLEYHPLREPRASVLETAALLAGTGA